MTIAKSPRSSKPNRSPLVLRLQGALVAILALVFAVAYYVPPRMCNPCNFKIPSAWSTVAVPDKGAIISVTHEGVIRVSTGEGMSLPVSTEEEICVFIQTVVEQNPNLPFKIKIDHRVPFATFSPVLHCLQEGRATKVYFISEQQTVSQLGS